MDKSLFFRLSFIALWALFGVVRGYYGRRTKTHGTVAGVIEKLKMAEEDMGVGFKAITAVITAVGAVGLILYLLSPPWWTWTLIPLGEWVQWLGIAAALAPIPFIIWVHHHLDKQWSIALEIQQDHRLITTVSLDLLVILFFAFSIWVNYRRIPREEQMLIEEFGEEYIEYIKASGRLLPRFQRDHT